MRHQGLDGEKELRQKGHNIGLDGEVGTGRSMCHSLGYVMLALRGKNVRPFLLYISPHDVNVALANTGFDHDNES
jgi:hypothetical protein